MSTPETTAGRGAAAAFGGGGTAAAGAAADAGADFAAAGAAAGAADGGGVPTGIATVAAVAETGAAAAGAAALMADGDGILMVGAAVGFGGKLMRTVSFLGWTFAASAGFGGTAAAGVTGGVVGEEPGVGGIGVFSAIMIYKAKLRRQRARVN